MERMGFELPDVAGGVPPAGALHLYMMAVLPDHAHIVQYHFERVKGFIDTIWQFVEVSPVFDKPTRDRCYAAMNAAVFNFHRVFGAFYTYISAVRPDHVRNPFFDYTEYSNHPDMLARSLIRSLALAENVLFVMDSLVVVKPVRVLDDDGRPIPFDYYAPVSESHAAADRQVRPISVENWVKTVLLNSQVVEVHRFMSKYTSRVNEASGSRSCSASIASFP